MACNMFNVRCLQRISAEIEVELQPNRGPQAGQVVFVLATFAKPFSVFALFYRGAAKESPSFFLNNYLVAYDLYAILQPMTFLGAADIDGALQRLGKRLLYDYVKPIALVVCGGSALNVLNLASRTTRDVDVLATVEETGNGIRLRHDKPLPKGFHEVVAEVGRDLGLDEDWLNMGPKNVLKIYGAPQGMTERWKRRDYGPNLTVYFVGRLDQVHLKLLAAADPKAEPRHMEDLLIRIKPTAEETRAAVTWLLDRKTSPPFRGYVRCAVEALGYDNISHSIPE